MRGFFFYTSLIVSLEIHTLGVFNVIHSRHHTPERERERDLAAPPMTSTSSVSGILRVILMSAQEYIDGNWNEEEEEEEDGALIFF